MSMYIPKIKLHSRESVGVSGVEQDKWQNLFCNEPFTAEIINDKFDYTINPLMQIFTVLVITVYSFFILRVANAQYRDVIAVKCGEPSKETQQ